MISTIGKRKEGIESDGWNNRHLRSEGGKGREGKKGGRGAAGERLFAIESRGSRLHANFSRRVSEGTKCSFRKKNGTNWSPRKTRTFVANKTMVERMKSKPSVDDEARGRRRVEGNRDLVVSGILEHGVECVPCAAGLRKIVGALQR